MDSLHAKEILTRYRPGSTGDSDPDLAQALEQLERDPDLARWFEQHRAFQAAVADRFKNLPLPAGLKDKILAGYRPAPVVIWRERPIYPALAAAAALVLLVSLAYLELRPREEQSFAAYRNRVVRHAQRGRSSR